MQAYSYVDGKWHDGNPPVLGPLSHATWLSGIIFDGARAFEGTTPDLDLHCERSIRSAKALGLRAPLTAGEVHELCLEGVRKFPSGTQLYIRPMFFAESGWIDPDPETTRFMLSVYESPMPDPTGNFRAMISPYRRPTPESAPTDAKASCLYPNSGRAMRLARESGFENAIILDQIGNVAEFATSTLFMVKDGTVMTPAPNGCFLNGITRQRVIKLLRDAGTSVVECQVTVKDLMNADEIFSTGNYAKVQPCTGVGDRSLQPGPVYTLARKLYWEFAHKG